MKKWLLILFCGSLICSSCSLFKKQKYGCPQSGAAIGAERIASGDPDAIKKSQKSKYKGRKSI